MHFSPFSFRNLVAFKWSKNIDRNYLSFLATMDFVGASPKLSSTPRRSQRLGVLGLPIPHPSISARSPYLIRSRHLNFDATETHSTFVSVEEETLPKPNVISPSPSLTPEPTLSQILNELNFLKSELHALRLQHEDEKKSMMSEIERLRSPPTPPTEPASTPDIPVVSTQTAETTSSESLPSVPKKKKKKKKRKRQKRKTENIPIKNEKDSIIHSLASAILHFSEDDAPKQLLRGHSFFPYQSLNLRPSPSSHFIPPRKRIKPGFHPGIVPLMDIFFE